METSASGGATPTHTTVPPGLAVSTAARIVSVRPTHSNTLSAMPSVNDSGSTGTAPTSRTRSRLPGSGSLTSTSDEPAATRSAAHRTPIGPAPRTRARSPGRKPPTSTACSVHARGSVSAAASGGKPSGTRYACGAGSTANSDSPPVQCDAESLGPYAEVRTRVVTVLAGAARDVGVYDDPLPYAEAFHLRSNLHDGPRELVPDGYARLGERVLTGGDVKISPAQSRSLDPDLQLAKTRWRYVTGLYFYPFPPGPDHTYAHELTIPCSFEFHTHSFTSSNRA